MFTRRLPVGLCQRNKHRETLMLGSTRIGARMSPQ
jgi:hypothetical protein